MLMNMLQVIEIKFSFLLLLLLISHVEMTDRVDSGEVTCKVVVEYWTLNPPWKAELVMYPHNLNADIH